MFGTLDRLLLWSILIVLLNSCTGKVIYSLSATEYSKLPPLFFLENYEACLEQKDGLYCVVKLDLYSNTENELMNTIRDYSADINRHYNHTNIDRGVCVRTTCSNYIKDRNLDDPDELSTVITECMNDEMYRKYGINAKHSITFDCDKHGEEQVYDTSDWAFLIFCAVLISLAVLAAVYECYLENGKEKKEGNQFLLSFSIKSNCKWLFATQCDDERMKSLRNLQAFRTILNVLMISAHSMLLLGCGFQNNPHDFERVYDNHWYYLLLNGLVIIQAFFFMAGFLLVYNLHVYAETKPLTWNQIPLIMVQRFFRIVPSLAVVIWFTSTWFRHMGSGPLWDVFVTNSVVSQCRVHWWEHLLFIQNYDQTDKYCVIPSWHLAADTQVFTIGLIVAVATLKKYRTRSLLLLLLVGTIAPALHAWYQDLDPFVIMRPEFYRTLDNPTFRNLHILGHNNLQSYVIGMIAAKFVYDWHKKGVDASKWKLYSAFHWLSIPIIAYFYYHGGVFYTDVKAPALYIALYAAAHRLIMALCSAFLMIGVAMRVPSPISKICENPIWVVLGRLTYAVFLLHMNFVHGLLGIRWTTIDINFQYGFMIYLGMVLINYILSIPYYLIVEAPFNRLCKVTTDYLFLKKIKEEVNEKKIE